MNGPFDGLRTGGDRPGLVIARMCGATAAVCGTHAVAECPAGPDHTRRWRKAWAYGFARSCISRFSKEDNGFGLFHVKPGQPRGRADWCDAECDFLTFTYRRLPVAALAFVLGRDENAIRIKACRLGLRKSG